MPDFIPGLILSEQFYREAVRPILDAGFPGLPHSAALIGSGSEVLGFDTEMSTDHDWGPRVMLFLPEEAHARRRETLLAALERELPPLFRGYPTRYSLSRADPPLCEHRVEVLTPRDFFHAYLGFDVEREPEPVDWLTFPEQKLRASTAGAVFHDGIGLQAIRDRFAASPRDVWLYLLAAGWTRVGQEEHLMGRAGLAGDEIGSALLGARLVRDLMRLCFLMEREYAPYPKWLGTAFNRLACGPSLTPLLQSALTAATWPERERHLAAAYEQVAARHNALGITEPLPAKVSRFHGRPFQVINGGAFADAIRARITDPAVRRIAAGRLIGSLDQWSDSTDLLCDPGRRAAVRGLYESGERDGLSV
jgi:hypothetical protein